MEPYIHTCCPLATSTGVYRGAMSKTKWLGCRQKENWDKFVENCPAQAEKVDMVPNWARRNMGLSILGRAATGVSPSVAALDRRCASEQDAARNGIESSWHFRSD